MGPRIRLLSLAGLLLLMPPRLRAAEPIEYKAPDGKFTVKFPTTPTRTAAGVSHDYQSYQLFSGRNQYAVMVAYCRFLPDLTPELTDRVLDQGRDSVLTQGTLLSEKKITLNDTCPGREILVKVKSGMGYVLVRLYLDQPNKTLYVIWVAGPTQDAARCPDVPDFLDSFKLGTE
jgi:hypothetical protein